MRKLLAVSTGFMLAMGLTTASGQEVSNEEVMQKLEELEQKVSALEQENEKLRSLLGRKGIVTPRKGTKKLQVAGRVLMRYSLTQDGAIEKGKTIYGDTPNSLIVRKARLQFKGKITDNIGYKILIRADRSTGVKLWDAFIDYKVDGFPLKLRIGQQKLPVSMSYLRPGTKIKFPERPIAVRELDFHDRDVGVRAIFKPTKQLQIETAVMNGEGVKQESSRKIANNKDRRLNYVFAVDATPIDTEDLALRVRAAYDTGYAYLYYAADNAKRNLYDIEASADIRHIGLIVEGGYSHDNPSKTKQVKGNPEGYYAQVDYKVPIEQLNNLHLLARYSSIDNLKVLEKGKYINEGVDYTSVGLYYLLKGWHAAIRSDYVWANEKGTEIDNNLFVTEFQFLF